jgi:hypothetical protein
MREDTGDYAHAACIEKAKSGQTADQPDMFAEGDTRVYKEVALGDLSKFKELYDDPPRSLGEQMGHPGGHYG